MYSTVFHGSKCPKAVCLTVCNFLDSRDSQWGRGFWIPHLPLDPKQPKVHERCVTRCLKKSMFHQKGKPVRGSRVKRIKIGLPWATWRPPGGQLFWVPDPAELSVTYRTRYWRSSSSESSNHNLRFAKGRKLTLMPFFHEGHCCTPGEAAKKSQWNSPCGKPNDINLQSLADFCHQFLVAYNQYMNDFWVHEGLKCDAVLGYFGWICLSCFQTTSTKWHPLTLIGIENERCLKPPTSRLLMNKAIAIWHPQSLTHAHFETTNLQLCPNLGRDLIHKGRNDSALLGQVRTMSTYLTWCSKMNCWRRSLNYPRTS